MCSRLSAGEVTRDGEEEDNFITGRHLSAKTRVPYKFTHAQTRSKKGTIDSDTWSIAIGLVRLWVFTTFWG